MPTKQEQQQAFEQDATAQKMQNRVEEITQLIALPPQPLLGDFTPPMTPFYPLGLEDELVSAAKALQDYKKAHYPLLVDEEE